MQLVVLIPSFLLFLYFIYKLTKEDYVFIRKNVSLEQVFDMVFVSLGVSLIFSRLFYLVFHYRLGDNLFLLFFSSEMGGFSFFGAFLGGLLTLYLFGQYKKLPLERLFDFIILAFVVALPVGFIGSALLAKDISIIFLLGNAIVYAIFAIFSLKYVHPKLESRELKEGNLYVIFLFFFSIVLLINAIMLNKGGTIGLITIESITLFLFFIFSIVHFVKQAQKGFINKKR